VTETQIAPNVHAIQLLRVKAHAILEDAAGRGSRDPGTEREGGIL